MKEPREDGRAADAAAAPDVIAWPPGVFLACLLLGAGIFYLVPLSFPNGRACAWIGGLFIAIGLVLALLTLREFHRWRTAYIPRRATTWLIRTGPFRLTRNPLYLAMSAIYLGLAMMLNNAWMVLLLPPAMILVTRKVILREERFLQRVFGEEYRRFRESVPRWLIK